MKKDLHTIRHAFGGRLVGTHFMKQMVCEAVSRLPEETIEFVTHKIWFLSSTEDAFGYAFNGSDLKDRHLIFLSDVLFQEHEHQILYTILHEIGHVVLKHRNSIGYSQTKKEIDKQEAEADEFAKTYL
jgi:hypothetical protein